MFNFSLTCDSILDGLTWSEYRFGAGRNLIHPPVNLPFPYMVIV